ncbi:MAG: cell wall metabolism sensor histidine kinase WalK [Anaerolineae bacterium]|nr:cell wall metabolism sensor histidine kinase WalK [Anaerolineae bacterium]
MKLLQTLQQRLGWKLFLSYLIIILVGGVVLASTAEFHAPAALARHIARMEALLGENPSLVADLDANFRAAVNEILVVAALAAFLAAVAVSIFTAQRIVGPLQAMMKASQRIAAGDYRQRVQVLGQDELGALARAFNRMAETLERTEQRRLELIGDVAHELRTPLSSIKGIMEGLVDGVLTTEPATFLLVQREVTRLQRLIHDLEELSRAEAGQVPLDPRAVAPADLVRAAADRLRPQFEGKSVSLHLDLPADLPQVRADPSRIIQVLLNLLGNALQYTPSNGQVTVRAWRDGREVVIVVQDTGIGIPPEHLPHIFERFYRVDKSRSRPGGGSGIGLTIARHLVEAHGGRIWATSPGPGQGSTFSFTLPTA